MKKILLIIFFLTIALSSLQAEDSITFNGKDVVATEGEAEVLFLAEDGSKVYAEYMEVCRNSKTGRFAKCPPKSENGGFISRKQERRCRDSETGRFIKCPK